MKKRQLYPSLSIIIPTLNSSTILKACLNSIKSQNYPPALIQLIIADGGSTDSTLKIATDHGAQIVQNPLKTAEAGKAAGMSQATNNLIAFIDSDNILPTRNWLKIMVSPFTDPEIIGSEPDKFTYRKQAGYIERYSALIGANDPYAFITGLSDRRNHINNRWTGLKLETAKFKNYLKITLHPFVQIPTIGANGTIFRRSFLTKHLLGDYLFDIDIVSTVLSDTKRPLFFAKVDIGIIHTYCENSLSKFIRKQNRRLTDYYTYLPHRTYNWNTGLSRFRTIYFCLYSLLIFPSLIDSVRGYFRRPDPAWFFHLPATLISFVTYALITLKYMFKSVTPIDRSQWNQ